MKTSKSLLSLLLSLCVCLAAAFGTVALTLEEAAPSVEEIGDTQLASLNAAEYHYSLSVSTLNASEFSAKSNNADGSLNLSVSSAGLIITGAPSETLDAADYPYFVIRATNNFKGMVYFRTSTSGSWSETNKIINYSVVKAADGTYYYIWNMSASGNYSGTITNFMYSARSAGTSVFYDMFLTDTYPSADGNVYHYPLALLRNEAVDGFAVDADGSVTVTASSSGNIYLDHVLTLDATVYNKLVIKANNLLSPRVYYSTTESGGVSEAHTLSTYSVVRADNGENYYIYDFSGCDGFTGNLRASTSFILGCRETGSMTISEMYVTDSAPTPASSIYSYNIKKLRSDAVTFTVSPTGSVSPDTAGVVYMDHTASLDASVYNKFVVCADENYAGTLWYHSSDYTAWKTRAVTKKMRVDNDGHYFYVYDLSTVDFSGTVYTSTGFMLQIPDAAVGCEIKEMFLTAELPDTLVHEYEYALSSVRYDSFSVTSNADGSLAVTLAADSGAFYFDNVGATLACATYNKFVLLATENFDGWLYYRSSDSTGLSEAKKISYAAKIKDEGDYWYYVYDLSSRSDFTGNFMENMAFMLSCKSKGTGTIKRIFVTDSLPAPNAHEYHYGLKYVRHEGYTSMTQTTSSLEITASSGGNLYLDHVTLLDMSVYNKLVIKANGDLKFKVYYMPVGLGVAESRTLSTYSVVRAKDGYQYYVYDFSGLAAYTGNLKISMGLMCAARAADTAEIVDMYVTDTAPDVEYDLPSFTGKYAVRVTAPMGMRFVSSIPAAARNDCTEYGYLVTREDLLAAEGLTADDFTLDFATLVSAPSYKPDESIDRISSIDAYNSLFKFACVLVGIPDAKSAYTSELVVRSYVKYGDVVLYDAPIVKSYYDVAVIIRDNADYYNSLDASTKSIIDSVIAVSTEE